MNSSAKLRCLFYKLVRSYADWLLKEIKNDFTENKFKHILQLLHKRQMLRIIIIEHEI